VEHKLDIVDIVGLSVGQQYVEIRDAT